MGVSAASVSEWVRGVSNPSLDRVERIPELLEVNGHWLLTGQGQMELPGAQPDLEQARRAGAEAAAAEVMRVVRQVATRYGTAVETTATAGGKGAGPRELIEDLEAETQRPPQLGTGRARRAKGAK